VATVNINEQMNQLGQIGSVGYDPTDAVVDALLGRARRARAVRQGSAALIGSVGAVGLGILGARIFVHLNNADDPALRDRSLINNDFAFLDQSWDDRYSEDYTGLDQTREEIAAAWDLLHAAAAEDPVEPTTTTTTSEPLSCTYEETTVDGWVKVRSPETGCVWKKDHRVETSIPDGYFLFGNGEIYQCQQWHDAATNTNFWGAYSGTGEWADKMIQCDPNDKYWYEYRYLGADATWNTSTRTCTGRTVNYDGAPHQISCRTTSALWSIYPDWSSANGGNPRWTLNNEDGKILIDPSTYKWFVQGFCGSTLASSSTTFVGRLHQCEEAYCDGWYYNKNTDHPVKNDHTYSWVAAENNWVQDPDPEPTPTPTPTPDPEPSVTPPPE
jgi:hypothetical protein